MSREDMAENRSSLLKITLSKHRVAGLRVTHRQVQDQNILTYGTRLRRLSDKDGRGFLAFQSNRFS